MASKKEVENPRRESIPRDSIEKPTQDGTEVVTASVALAAAMAEQKPNPWSKSMVRLYGIMAVGYLISTLNGFGMLLVLSLGRPVYPR